jgi:hypothetical protein
MIRRRNRIRRLLALAALLSAPLAAKADAVRWSDTAGWQITVDRPTSSCGMTRTFSRGTTILVMYDRPSRAFSFGLANRDWDARIQNGASYTIKVVMDGSSWESSFQGVTDAGRPFLIANGVKTEFLTDFMRRNHIQFFNATSGSFITGMTLAGSYAALSEMLECQRAMNASLES